MAKPPPPPISKTQPASSDASGKTHDARNRRDPRMAKDLDVIEAVRLRGVGAEAACPRHGAQGEGAMSQASHALIEVYSENNLS